jgi:hypothetical protein
MTYKPIIVSVPHSGTRFLIERLGIEDHVHTHIAWDTLWERTEGRSIVVPLRSPVDIFRSWCRRHDPKSFPFGEFFMAWGFLHALDQMVDLDVICVDHCADPRITDWSKVGDGDGSRADWKLHKVDLRALYKLPIVHRHYGAWSARLAA